MALILDLTIRRVVMVFFKFRNIDCKLFVFGGINMDGFLGN